MGFLLNLCQEEFKCSNKNVETYTTTGTVIRNKIVENFKIGNTNKSFEKNINKDIREKNENIDKSFIMGGITKIIKTIQFVLFVL